MTIPCFILISLYFSGSIELPEMVDIIVNLYELEGIEKASLFGHQLPHRTGDGGEKGEEHI